MAPTRWHLSTYKSPWVGLTPCIRTGVEIPGKNWNAAKERVVGLPNAATLTRDLLNTYYEVIECYNQLKQREQNITPKRLKAHFENPVDTNFSAFYRKEMEIEAKGKAYGTGRSYAQTINSLDEFRKNISFEEICQPSLLLDFAHWLSADKGQKKNNVHKHYKNLRKFINIAILRGHIPMTENPIPALKGKIKTEKVQIVYLTEYELAQIEELRLEGKDKVLEKWRRLFLFTCYTGLRFGDATNLRESDLEFTDSKEGTLLYLKAEKTDKTNFLPLGKLFCHPEGGLSKPERIIKSVMDHPKYRPGQRLFPFNHVQSYNRALKKMIKGLDMRPVIFEKLTSHVGRKTCVNLLYKISGDDKLIKAIVQHSQDRELMTYLDINSQVISRRLENLKW